MSSSHRLLIVSNRLPITAAVTAGEISLTQASGGLATGLRGCHERTGGLWIGWPGVADLPEAQQATLDAQLGERGIVAVHLTDDEIRDYYEDFSNGVLWPLFHYLLDRLPLGPKLRGTPIAASTSGSPTPRSRITALAISIWVHDYQLMLVPR